MVATLASAAILPVSTGVAQAANPPTIDPIPNQCWNLNQQIPPLSITAHPGTGGPIVKFFTPTGMPSGSFTLSGQSITNNANNVTVALTGTPTATGFGTASITVQDNSGATATRSWNWSVPSVPCGTDVVTVQPIPSQTFTAGQQICPINIAASSSTNRSLGYQATGLPAGLSIPNGAQGSHAITGTPSQTGSGTATITVNDPTDITATTSFNWTVNNTPASSDTMSPGQQIEQGGAITSLNGQYQLRLQNDGNLVVYGNGIPVWSLGTTTGAVLANQCDGNLVLYNASGTALWASGTAGNGGSRLVMQNDGNLVLYRTSDGSPAWSSGSFCEPLTATDRLQSGQCLARGGVKLHSPDGRFTLWLQNDGNLVLYQDTTPLWSTGTSATSPTSGAEWLSNQNDGNLVLYNNGVVTSSSQALFNTGTSGNGQSTLILQNDGNLVLYRNSDGAATWASNTCCH
jgi:hypothetical protein